MRRCARGIAVAMVAVCAMAVGVPSASGGSAGWPLTAAAPVVVGFGESYAAPDGSTAVHRGLDIAAAAGASVLAVLEGTVTFAGRIPAGEGATTLAVTIESGDVRLTYSPLADVAVAAGDALAPGQPLGTLAGTGDRSHPEPHVHLSARRGSLYIDPGPFLLPPVTAAPATALEAVPVPVTAVQPITPAGAVAPAVTSAPGQATVPVRAPATSPSGISASSPAASPVPVSAPAGTPAVAGTVVAQAPTNAAVTRSPVPAPHAPSLQLPVASTGLPAPASLPTPAVAALASDRRAQIAEGTALPVSGLAAATAVLAALLLWPVWRAMPALSVPVIPERQDVAAVVAR